MFRSLARALEEAGYGAGALFDLHPSQLLAIAEAVWERERNRRGLPWSGLADVGPALQGYGAERTATGALLDGAGLQAAVTAALASDEAPPTLAFAWLAEGSGLISAMSALAQAELNGASTRLVSDGSRRWLRSCEVVFAGENLLTLRDAMRPAPALLREQQVRRAFGAPVSASGVLLDEAPGSATTVLGAWLGGDDTAWNDVAGLADAPAGFAREAFAAGMLVSWFYLSLTLQDSPIALDLGLAKQDAAGRLAGLAAALGWSAHTKGGALLEAAVLLDGVLRDSTGAKPEDRAALAALWADLRGQPDEDPETGAGGDIGLAFGGSIRLDGAESFSFGDLLQPSVLKVTDPDARVRAGPPSFGMTSARIPIGTDVVTTDVALVSDVTYLNLSPVVGGEPQWTKLGNVTVPPNALVGLIRPSDKSQTGPFAMWEKGSFIGYTSLWLVGKVGGMVLVAEATLSAYLEMLAEADAAGHELSINSGFRSYPEQKALYDAYLAKRGNLAARPGSSNHQSGVAIDLGMGMGKGNPSADTKSWTPIYRWMVGNARRFGFMRTVESEAWHWEHRPTQAPDHDTFGNWTALKKAGG